MKKALLCLLGIGLLGAATQTVNVDSYGIPFGELLGATMHVWCYEDDAGHAAVFTAIGGEFCGAPSPRPGVVALRTMGVPLRVDYDPPVNGVQVYMQSEDGITPSTMRCFLAEAESVQFLATTLRSGTSYASRGPEVREENHWAWCEFTNAVIFNYSVKYVE